jgi:dTDP-glucose 4,6-dehydratase
MSRNVLISGGAGFIAHTVIGHLLKNTDWNIVALDRLDFSGNLNRLADMMQDFDPETRKRVRVEFHDLRAELNPQLIHQIGPVDIVLHLAAGSHVDRSIEFPMEFVQDNVVGTCNILNYARQQDKLERFVYFSTDEVFGPAPDGIAYKERDRYNSTNPYSASKAAGEELCVAFENTYKMPIFVTHTMNVFGQRQHPEKFIPMAIQKVRDGETVSIHSDSTRTKPGSRHYIHAEDVASGLLHLLHLPDNWNNSLAAQANWDLGGAHCPKFNLVGKEEIDNLTLARYIAEAQNKPLNYELVDFHSSRPGHDLRYALSGDYMRKLGWEPQISLKERITEVVDWTLKNPRWLRR